MNIRLSMVNVKGRGAGLGNQLIPWARSFLAAQVVGAHTLPPAFGLNNRQYWRHFRTSRYDYIWQYAIRSVLPVVEFREEHWLKYGGGDVTDAFENFAIAQNLHDRSNYIINTEGMWGGYRHITAARQFIASTLYQSRYAASNLLRLERRLDRKKLIVAKR